MDAILGWMTILLGLVTLVSGLGAVGGEMTTSVAGWILAGVGSWLVFVGVFANFPTEG